MENNNSTASRIECDRCKGAGWVATRVSRPFETVESCRKCNGKGELRKAVQ